jgi:hypothetical protein
VTVCATAASIACAALSRLQFAYFVRITRLRGALAQLLHDGPSVGDIMYSIHADRDLALKMARDSSVAGSAYGHTAMAYNFEYGMVAQVRTSKKKALQHYTVALPASFSRFIILLYFSSPNHDSVPPDCCLYGPR